MDFHTIVNILQYRNGMAVASGLAGQVLARPPFRRPNLHMRTLH